MRYREQLSSVGSGLGIGVSLILVSEVGSSACQRKSDTPWHMGASDETVDCPPQSRGTGHLCRGGLRPMAIPDISSAEVPVARGGGLLHRLDRKEGPGQSQRRFSGEGRRFVFLPRDAPPAAGDARRGPRGRPLGCGRHTRPPLDTTASDVRRTHARACIRSEADTCETFLSAAFAEGSWWFC